MSRNQREGRYCGKSGARHRRDKHWTFWLIAGRIWARETDTAPTQASAIQDAQDKEGEA